MKGTEVFRKIWLWALFIGFALFMISSSSGSGPTWNPAEQLIIEFTAPFQKFIKRAINSTEEFWTDYLLLVGIRRENKLLKKEIDALRIENNRYKELVAAQERLRELLKFKETFKRPAIAAQVIGRDPSGWFKSIIIDKGKLSGLKQDMPVVTAAGVVGRIVSVSPHYAKVLLIIDQNSAVDCLAQGSRDRGMVKGFSNELCKMHYVAKSADVTVKDIVVTSGLGGIFPKGLPVGQVLKVEENPAGLFKLVDIRPAVDFSKLEEVLVLLEDEKFLEPLENEK